MVSYRSLHLPDGNRLIAADGRDGRGDGRGGDARALPTVCKAARGCQLPVIARIKPSGTVVHVPHVITMFMFLTRVLTRVLTNLPYFYINLSLTA